MSSNWTSGSGHSCTAYLVPRTLARQIDLNECIGKGRYGEVHCGVWQGEDVAIKIFYARDESSWLQETQIYNSVLLRHEYILAYYGSDMISKDDRTELWLITQFHPLGSLYDYLMHHELDVETTLNFVYSMASGLNHLHTEIRGTAGKRSIAHRDLKAKNILVKNDLTCCIADLGLAVMHDPESEEPPDVPTHKVGTKRYMSPEMLMEEMNVFKFHAFRCADMYSLGLVLWETVRRCKVDNFACEYSIPYHDKLPHDPDFHEVRTVVVDQKYRPPPPTHVKENTETAPLIRLMMDCWRMDPLARITALRIKKTLYDIRRQRRRPNLPAVAEEGAAVLQPQRVALPPLAQEGAVGNLSTTYSARGPETDQLPESGQSDSFPAERSEALYLPPAAVEKAKQNAAGSHHMPAPSSPRYVPQALLARSPNNGPPLSTDSYEVSSMGMSTGDQMYPLPSHAGGSVGSMSMSIERASAPLSVAAKRNQQLTQSPPHRKPAAVHGQAVMSRPSMAYQESTMSAESNMSVPPSSKTAQSQAASTSAPSAVRMEHSASSRNSIWTESSC